MKYIIHNDSGIFAELDLPGSLHSTDFTAIQDKFKEDFRRSAIDMLHPYPGDEAAGVAFVEELNSSSGMDFWLIKFPETTKEQILAAKKELKSNRDVVHIKVIELKQKVDFVLPEFRKESK